MVASAIQKRRCYARIAKTFFRQCNKVLQDRKINVEKPLLHSGENYFFISELEPCCQFCKHQGKICTGLSLFYFNLCCKRHNKSPCLKVILDVSGWAHPTSAPLLMRTQDGIWLSKAGKKGSHKTLKIKEMFFVITNKRKKIFFQATVLTEAAMRTAENSRWQLLSTTANRTVWMEMVNPL